MKLGANIPNSKDKQSKRERSEKKARHEVELQKVLCLDKVQNYPKGSDIFVPNSQSCKKLFSKDKKPECMISAKKFLEENGLFCESNQITFHKNK